MLILVLTMSAVGDEQLFWTTDSYVDSGQFKDSAGVVSLHLGPDSKSRQAHEEVSKTNLLSII